MRDLLINQLDDEYASEEDLFDVQEIIEDPLLEENGPGNRLRQILVDEHENNVLNARINVSKLEILYSSLEFSMFYHLPQSGIAHLFQMLNMYLDTSELPQSRYLIDKIFNCNTDVDYYALCPTCKNFVRRFDRELDRYALCQGCNLRFSLKDPTYGSFF